MFDDYLKISINKEKISIVGSVLSIIPIQKIQKNLSVDETPRKASDGSIVFARVSNKNGYKNMEMLNFNGRMVKIYPGDLIVGVIGLRESTTHIVGKVPDFPLQKGSEINLLSEGGIIGSIKYIPSFMGDPIILEVLGFLKNKDKLLNLHDFKPPLVNKCSLPPIILITGTSSEIGKTTLATKIINVLSREYGLKVCSVIMSGTGSKADILNHRAAGSAFFHSFIETGFSNSYGCSKEEFLPAIENLFYKIATVDKPDIIIGEMGGDFVWGNNDSILKKSVIMEYAKWIIVLTNDLLSAVGTKVLFKDWGIKVPVSFANSWLRSYGGMNLRFNKILNTSLLDVRDGESVKKFISNILLGCMFNDNKFSPNVNKFRKKYRPKNIQRNINIKRGITSNEKLHVN